MALTAGKARKRLGASRGVVPVAVKSGQTFYKGALVAVDATGYLVPGAVSTALKVRGVVDTGRDMKIVTTANGEVELSCESGIFLFNNSSAGDAIAQADVGATCYVVDDDTVAKTNGSSTRSAAGEVIKVTAQGVYVKVGPL